MKPNSALTFERRVRTAPGVLTHREKELCAALAEHKTYAAAAKSLDIRPASMRDRMQVVREKLNVGSNKEAIERIIGA